MSELGQVVEVIAHVLADHPDAVTVTESAHRGTTVVELTMAPGDLGRVIGRGGRTALAIRTLVGATAERLGTRATVEFRDSPRGS